MDVDPGVYLLHPELDQSPRSETQEAPSLTAAMARQTRILQKIAEAVHLTRLKSLSSRSLKTSTS
jgi:hypothetical protein